MKSTRKWWVVAVALCAIAWAPDVHARVHLKVTAVERTPKKEAEGLSEKEAAKATEARRLRRRELARETAKRLSARLSAAGFKHATAQPTKRAGEVEIVVHDSKVERAWVERVVFGTGEVSLRPVLERGESWAGIEGELPEGVELRGEGDGLYPYSLDAQALARFASRLSFADATLLVAPRGAGWGLVALGEPIATHADLTEARLDQGRAGERFARARVSDSVFATWVASEAGEWAIVLDSEVVSLVGRPDARSPRELMIRCPRSVAASAECASQIAGRLAAHIPVVLVPVDDGRGSE